MIQFEHFHYFNAEQYQDKEYEDIFIGDHTIRFAGHSLDA